MAVGVVLKSFLLQSSNRFCKFFNLEKYLDSNDCNFDLLRVNKLCTLFSVKSGLYDGLDSLGMSMPLPNPAPDIDMAPPPAAPLHAHAHFQAWLPDGYSHIFRIVCVWPFGLLDYGSAALHCKI